MAVTMISSSWFWPVESCPSALPGATPAATIGAATASARRLRRPHATSLSAHGCRYILPPKEKKQSDPVPTAQT